MRHLTAVLSLTGLLASGLSTGAEETVANAKPSIKVSEFRQEISTHFEEDDGLPSNNVHAVAVAADNTVYAGTAGGVARFSEKIWAPVSGIEEVSVSLLAAAPTGGAFCVAGGTLYRINGGEAARFGGLPAHCRSTGLTVSPDRVFVSCEDGIIAFGIDTAAPIENPAWMGLNPSAMIAGPDGQLVVAAKSLLFSFDAAHAEGAPIDIRDRRQNWAAADIKGLAFDSMSRLWFANPHGVGSRAPDGAWSLYTGVEGLPYDQFTCVAPGIDGVVWFGTEKGAICFDGKHWAYRQGRRWLPDDDVRSIAVDRTGNAWFATPRGVALIERRPLTLKEKAKSYEDAIDTYHRRTEYGYVAEVHLKDPTDLSEWKQADTDNDGLWTSMYGAGECFAYGATKDPKAKERAKAAFEALRFLQVVTQGGDPPAPPGFIARTVLPTSGPNPNAHEYTEERDLIMQKRDSAWKVMTPRWPKSADGKWYWKCDTSSDELDGHYFFYGQYYDLVADTDEEKQRVREVVSGLTDHLVDHDFCLVDWDGKPTRWAVFSPSQLNGNPDWFAERGLNSLSMLSYLATAYHITENQKYRDAFDMLVKDHGYAMNLMHPKVQYGPGSGNQSDDEMAFMSFYNLVKYSPDPTVREMTMFSFNAYWTLEIPELNPFFNFAYAGVSIGGSFKQVDNVADLSPQGEWLEQSVDTLERIPLDRVNWRSINSHRIDILPMPPHTREPRELKGKGYRRNGFVIPADETHFNHWNYDPWELDVRTAKWHELATGTVYLLPYYMGLYHGFIAE